MNNYLMASDLIETYHLLHCVSLPYFFWLLFRGFFKNEQPKQWKRVFYGYHVFSGMWCVFLGFHCPLSIISNKLKILGGMDVDVYQSFLVTFLSQHLDLQVSELWMNLGVLSVTCLGALGIALFDYKHDIAHPKKSFSSTPQ